MLTNKISWVLCLHYPGISLFKLTDMKNILYTIALAILCFSCSMDMEQEIDWKIDRSPDMIVVESIITNELKQQCVHLTRSGDYYDTLQARAVTDAQVMISEGANSFSFTESESQPGYYYSDEPFAGEPLKTYVLNINLNQEINGLSSYSAESTMPNGIEMDSAQFSLYEMPEFELGEDDGEEKDTTILEVYFFGQEPVETGNYYLTKTFRNGLPLEETAKEYRIYNDETWNGEYTLSTIFVYNLVPDDLFTFRIYSIEKGFYKFLEGILNSESTGGMGSVTGPPANAVGNIDKGLGYFGAAFVSQKTGPVIDKRE